ncbi:MAG: LysM peptidoglycan-binding domain-containing protein, partial [Actinomycetota bacterium]
MADGRWSNTGRARGGAVLVAATLLVGVFPGVAHARLDYRVQGGDTLSAIAARHGVSATSLVDANGLDDPDRIVAGTVLVIPGGEGPAGGHVVQPGETLSAIAARYGVSTSALAEANGITNPNLIRAGQHLRVAAGSSSAAQPATSSAAASTTSSSRDDVRRLITQEAQRHGWRPAVPLGLAMQESGWNNSVVSSPGARCIMQVMPATGEWVGRFLLGRSLVLSVPADNVAA